MPSGEKEIELIPECPICTNISGPSAAKAEAELMDSMKIIPKQIDKKKDNLLILNILSPFIYLHDVYLSGKNDFTDSSKIPLYLPFVSSGTDNSRT
ncbi:MAG: hypothetical protein NT140_11865 [Deltaproteobacteria bacterium]|nr:hypothetical protein [Deltaproteobacteria bacterium]